MEYIYPAIFHYNDDDGSYTISYPDLPGCISEGKTLSNAITMAQTALLEWIEYLKSKNQIIPQPSNIKSIEILSSEFVNLIKIECQIKEDRAVRRTVSIPKWMDTKVADAGLSLSKILQDALLEKIN